MRFLAVLLAAWLLLGTPFPGGSVSELCPVEILCLSSDDGGVTAVCDGGIAARGRDVTAAVKNLHTAAPGRLELGTVDQVVFVGLTPDTQKLLDAGLRPAAGLYLSPVPVEDPDALARYLRSHGGGVTLGMLEENGTLPIPMLAQGETGLILSP